MSDNEKLYGNVEHMSDHELRQVVQNLVNRELERIEHMKREEKTKTAKDRIGRLGKTINEVTKKHDYEPSYSTKDYKPVSELEGLQVGDNVYSLQGNNIVEWVIESDCGSTLFIEYGCCNYQVTVDGFVTLAGKQEKQSFWRTKERAEKYGKAE